MYSQQDLDLVSVIYDLPLQPNGWMDVLDQFAPAMNAAGAGVLVFDPINAEYHVSEVTSNYHSYDPTFLDDYNQRFGAAEKEGYAKLAMHPKRQFITDMEGMGIESLEEQGQQPAVQWLMEHYNVRHRAVSCMNLERIWSDFLSVQFDKDRGPISTDERKKGLFFLDHFAKSVELGRAFSVLQSRFNGIFTALDRFHIGIFVLSPNGSVVVKNCEAERILSAGDGLSMSREGQLLPQDDNQRAQLKEAIIKAILTAQAEDHQAETLMTLSRRSGNDPYLIEVAPIRDHVEIESQFNGCLVFVIDPTKTDVVSTDGMQALYGLTDAEASLCALVAKGMGTDEMAQSREITRETVRSYIKKILQKTGVKNRSQLVRLALNVNLPIDSAPAEE